MTIDLQWISTFILSYDCSAWTNSAMWHKVYFIHLRFVCWYRLQDEKTNVIEQHFTRVNQLKRTESKNMCKDKCSLIRWEFSCTQQWISWTSSMNVVTLMMLLIIFPVLLEWTICLYLYFSFNWTSSKFIEVFSQEDVWSSVTITSSIFSNAIHSIIREKHRSISTDISSAHPSEKFTPFSIKFFRSKMKIKIDWLLVMTTELSYLSNVKSSH